MERKQRDVERGGEEESHHPISSSRLPVHPPTLPAARPVCLHSMRTCHRTINMAAHITFTPPSFIHDLGSHIIPPPHHQIPCYSFLFLLVYVVLPDLEVISTCHTSPTSQEDAGSIVITDLKLPFPLFLLFSFLFHVLF